MIYHLSKNMTVLGKIIVKPDKSFSFLSYLITGKKNVLIDTVPERAAEDFIHELNSCIPLESLDALILNHSEGDHSGALALLLERRPDLLIYCTPECKQHLLPLYPKACLNPVYSESSLTIGSSKFYFIHTPGLHWDDNMTTFFENEQILFSNDLFGQSLGAAIPLDSQFSLENILGGLDNYYQNVFSTASSLEKAVIFNLINLKPEYIAPGHGVILKTHLQDVLNYYKKMCGA